MDRYLRGGRVAWCLVGLLALGGVAALAGGILAWRGSHQQIDALAAQLEHELQAAQVARQAEQAALPSTQGRNDFTMRLSDAPHVPEVVQALHRACAEAGVALVSLQSQVRPATASELGRAQLTVVMKGGYVPLRQALGDVLGRYADVSVQRLRARRMTSPLDVEATVVLSVWARALQPADATASAAGLGRH